MHVECPAVMLLQSDHLDLIRDLLSCLNVLATDFRKLDKSSLQLVSAVLFSILFFSGFDHWSAGPICPYGLQVFGFAIPFEIDAYCLTGYC